MTTITQDMRYKQSLMKYAVSYSVSKASRKYNRPRSYIYFWLKRWDGSIDSLRPKSRRPHHH
ncbi:MAG: helix-turn-helix domain-containing protein, partial [Clostridia bacterium]|nr:helix-turn-helix domain-containing protein [Clostridia bacterium]